MRLGLRSIVPRRFLRSERLRKLIMGQSRGQVMAGPFAGMRYGDRAFGSMLIPKLVGTYELELHHAVYERFERAYGRVVVAGAAEGYYAIGFALRIPGAQVVAFEASAAAREELASIAAMNGVGSRMTELGICDAPALSEALGDGRRVLVICDLEGAEAALLDPRVVPGLRQADLIVETHDEFVPGVRELVAARFLGTHSVERVMQVARRAEDAKAIRTPASFRGALEQLISERRPAGIDWLLLDARPGSESPLERV